MFKVSIMSTIATVLAANVTFALPSTARKVAPKQPHEQAKQEELNREKQRELNKNARAANDAKYYNMVALNVQKATGVTIPAVELATREFEVRETPDVVVNGQTQPGKQTSKIELLAQITTGIVNSKAPASLKTDAVNLMKALTESVRQNNSGVFASVKLAKMVEWGQVELGDRNHRLIKEVTKELESGRKDPQDAMETAVMKIDGVKDRKNVEEKVEELVNCTKA